MCGPLVLNATRFCAAVALVIGIEVITMGAMLGKSRSLVDCLVLDLEAATEEADITSRQRATSEEFWPIPNSEVWAASKEFDHIIVMRYIELLKDATVVVAESVRKIRLTEEGKRYMQQGSPEVIVFNAVPREGVSPADLKAKLDAVVYEIGFAKAMENEWLQTNSQGLITRKVEYVKDKTWNLLSSACQEGKELPHEEELNDLKKRKLIESRTWFRVKEGPWFRTVVSVPEESPWIGELQQSAICRRPDNFVEDLGHTTERGHPLLKVWTILNHFFLHDSGGSEEMAFNNFDGSSFGNLDTAALLDQPQQNPARDFKDTFVAVNAPAPMTIDEFVRYYLSRMPAEEHAQSGFIRWAGFSMDRVNIENDSVDRTRLSPGFQQVQGFICDQSNLKLEDFILKLLSCLGISEVQFVPVYNRYTVNTMEIISMGKQKEVTLGYGGMLRPEILQRMGLPKDMCVMVWGLSLERISQIYLDLPNREKCGICFEEILYPRMWSVRTCKHMFCDSCLESHARILARETKVVSCPEVGCDQKLDSEEQQLFIPPKELENNTVPLGERVYCPNPDCASLMRLSDFASLEQDTSGAPNCRKVCKHCEHAFCLNCRVPWHENSTCEEYKPDIRLPAMDWRRCERCKHGIERRDGCNEMTCRCGYKFCFICEKEWNVADHGLCKELDEDLDFNGRSASPVDSESSVDSNQMLGFYGNDFY